MNIALVDDEIKSLNGTESIIKRYLSEKDISAEIFRFQSGEDFLLSAKSREFSIVFMDVYMDKLNGVETAARLREIDRGCLIVFLTTSMDFFREAFACHAFEYVPKPVEPENIFKVLDDAFEVLPEPYKFIEVNSERRNIKIFLGEIVSVISDSHYIVITLTGSRKVRSRMTLTDFTKLIKDDPRFIYVNRGILLNADHVISIDVKGCEMDSGENLPIKIREAQEIEKAVREYTFDVIRKNQTNNRRRN